MINNASPLISRNSQDGYLLILLGEIIGLLNTVKNYFENNVSIVVLKGA